MWNYLKKVYNHDHKARRFQLKYEIAYYAKGNLTILDYFSRFQNFWCEFVDIVYDKVLAESLVAV